MSIVGAAFLPHAPLLLPTTDPEHQKALCPLIEAYTQVAQWVHAAQPDCIICCNPHALSVGNTFTFSLSRRITVHFEEFGDLTTTVSFQGSPTLAFHLKELLEPHSPVAVSHESVSNYGIGIPVLMLQDRMKHVPWVEISSRQSTLEEHVLFGTMLQDELLNTRQRVLLIASGEVSANASQPFIQDWTQHARAGTLMPYLLKLKTEHVLAAQSCGAWSAAQVQGALRSLRVHPELLFSGAPYGVAYQIITWQPL